MSDKLLFILQHKWLLYLDERIMKILKIYLPLWKHWYRNNCRNQSNVTLRCHRNPNNWKLHQYIVQFKCSLIGHLKWKKKRRNCREKARTALFLKYTLGAWFKIIPVQVTIFRAQRTFTSSKNRMHSWNTKELEKPTSKPS